MNAGDRTWPTRCWSLGCYAIAVVGLFGSVICTTLAGCNKPQAPASSSSASITDTVSRHTQRLLTNPEIQKTVSGRPQPEAMALLDTLARRGFKRLSNEQLLQRAVIRGRLLASVDVTTCAAIVRDAATTAQMNTALAKLETAEVEKFLTLKEAAVLAEARQQQPPAFAQDTEFPPAFGALLEALPQEQAEHLAMLLSGEPTRASNDDLCWAERTFLDTLVSLREPYRSSLTRGVVQ